MSTAKQPTQPPQFDAGAFAKHAGITPADIANFQKWKQWVGGELAFDGVGLRDVVATNATFLNAVKQNVDQNGAGIVSLEERVTVLEARPAVPFPASGQLKDGGT